MSLRLGGVGEGATAVCGCEVSITKRLLLHRVTVGEPDIICCYCLLENVALKGIKLCLIVNPKLN